MVISVSNLKGGVGKTTIATNIAVAFRHRGHEVCLVDTDLGQQSAMEWAGNRSSELMSVPVFGVSLKQLNNEVAQLRHKYDFVIIDGSPQLSELADRTILSSDLLIIPLTPSIYDYRGFESFLQRYEQIKQLKLANDQNIQAYVLFNRVVLNSNISKDIEDAVREYDIRVFNTRLINRVAYADSASDGLGILEYKDKKAIDEINGLTNEILTEIQINKDISV